MENIASEITPEEITLEALKEGKFNIKQIPRKEFVRLAKEEKETLPEEHKQLWEYGWRTKPFFLGLRRDGTEQEWKSAEEYSDFIQSKPPVQQERLRHLAKEKEDAQLEISKLKSQISKMNELQKMQAERAIKKDKQSIELEIKEAKEFGDVDRYAEASARKSQIEMEERVLKEFDEPAPAPVNVQSHSNDDILFAARNPWFHNNVTMRRYAIGLDNEIIRSYPNISRSEQLRMIENDIKQSFPEHFSSSSPSNTPAVDSSRNNSSNISAKTSGITFDQLPQDEQTRIDNIIRLGLGSYKSRNEYLKQYNSHIKDKR